ncbi:MAG: iron ABC transporter permease [Gammaproteobacteria bacterium]|nr:iron ABC transporter permease [Gammaproteobacteria bacterium]
MPVRTSLLLTTLILLALCCAVFSLLSGSVATGWGDLLAALSGNADPTTSVIILELRWPRTAAAFVTGALLALAGGLMQVLLRNPLADPYVLGISGGAASGALLAMLLGAGTLLLHGTAFGGALFSMLLVFGLAHGSGSWTSHRLLLTGVVVAAGWGALIAFLLAISPDAGLRGMLFWLMGDLSHAGTPLAGGVLLLVGLVTCFGLGRSLNTLAHGANVAHTLGVNVDSLRRAIYLLASVLTASAVTLAGSIGFVGLIVPHMLRLLGVRDHRLLLPAAALLGGSLLIIADTLARTLFAPRQLPVGVLTALVGVPLFLLLLYRTRNGTGTREYG